MNKRRAILLNGKSWSAEHSKKLVNYLASYDMLIIDPHLHREIFVRLLENLKTCLEGDFPKLNEEIKMEVMHREQGDL